MDKFMNHENIELKEINDPNQLEFDFTDNSVPSDVQLALENVIMLARTGMDSLGLKTDIWGTVTADALIARDSIDLVKETFLKKV
tara:strand:- start:466 stop:720 length:255 start_codon:yes stop_codon:yes gene_type:complete